MFWGRMWLWKVIKLRIGLPEWHHCLNSGLVASKRLDCWKEAQGLRRRVASDFEATFSLCFVFDSFKTYYQPPFFWLDLRLNNYDFEYETSQLQFGPNIYIFLIIYNLVLKLCIYFYFLHLESNLGFKSQK